MIKVNDKEVSPLYGKYELEKCIKSLKKHDILLVSFKSGVPDHIREYAKEHSIQIVISYAD